MEHTTIRNGKLFCLNCGGEHNLSLPAPVREVARLIKAFNTLHKNCKKTWEEPQADQNRSVIDRAHWWIAHGEVGASSRTMWDCFMGHTNFPINHPYDPDDFKRCYKLLQAIPEWKNDLERLKPLSKAWR